MPAASSTAWLTKFSEAISSRPDDWRVRSLAIAAAISGSTSLSRAGIEAVVDMAAGLDYRDLEVLSAECQVQVK